MPDGRLVKALVKLSAYMDVLAGPISAEQENAVWHAVMGMRDVQAQPMTAWLLSSQSLWGDKRERSTQIADVLGISHKTLEAGTPKRTAKVERGFQRLNAHIGAVLAETCEEMAVRRKRAIWRTNRAIESSPDTAPCTLFHHSMGIAGGDALEKLAIAVDEISAAVLRGEVERPQVAPVLVEVAEHLQIIRPASVIPRPDLDPGLDALLMLYARLDRDLMLKLHADDCRTSSLFSLLMDASTAGLGRRARHRLIDMYYGFSVVASGRALPDQLPSVRELEEALTGVPASGGQSWIVRWRTGRKHLRLRDVQAIAAHVNTRTGRDIEWYLRMLWLVAQFCELVESSGPTAVEVAGARYRAWWDAMHDPGRSDTPLVDSYWGCFQPHA